MEIINDALAPLPGAVDLVNSPNVGGAIVPEYLVIHYTAGRSGASSVAHFMDPAAKASAHIVLDRSGKIWQLAPFNRATWHAGISMWSGRHSLNGFSIGIELDNAGKLKKLGDRYQSWFGALYDETEVVRAKHRAEDAEAYWHAYTEPQLTALMEVSRLLVARYSLKDVLGHDDIAPGRKVDPGPAFSMGSFRSALFGRTDVNAADYRVAVPLLNLRAGPGTEYAVIAALRAQARLCLLEMRDMWAKVVLLEGSQATGWVRNSFITLATP